MFFYLRHDQINWKKLGSGYKIRWFREQDVDAYIRGLNDALYDCYDLRRFRWKFVENPYNLGFTPIAVVEEEVNGRPVGFNGFVPFQVVAGGERFLAVQGCDGFVDHDHQRRGLFSKTLEFMEAEKVDKGPELLLSFNFLGSTATAQKTGSIAVCTINKWTFEPDAFASMVSDLRRGATLEPCGIEDVHRVYQRWSKATRYLHIHRDLDYLKWRYRNPLRQYTFHLIERRGSVKGYVILGIEEDEGSNIMGIDDYVLLDLDPRILMGAVFDLAGPMEGLGCIELSTIQGGEMDQALTMLGAEPEPRSTMILKGIKGVEARGDRLFRGNVEISDAKDWYITNSDMF